MSPTCWRYMKNHFEAIMAGVRKPSPDKRQKVEQLNLVWNSENRLNILGIDFFFFKQ